MCFPSLRRRVAVLALLFAALSLAGGCSGPKESAPVGDGEPRAGGTLRLALDGDPGTLNPLRMTNTHAARVYALLQPGVFRLDTHDGSWQPGLVRAWTFREDSTEVDLELDTDLRWSDGEAFTAEDLRLSLEIYADERCAYRWRSRLDPITEVRVLDPAHLRVRFSQRLADPLSRLTHDVLPSHVVASLPRDAVETWSIGRQPVTLGPFALREWKTNDRLLLERNPYYPHAALVDAVELQVLPDAASRWLRLRTGEVDVVGAVSVDQARNADAGIEIRPVASRSVAFLQYNLRDERLADVRVRRALSLALDREAITEGIFDGHAQPAATLVPPVSWAFHADLAPDRFDPARAARLLDEAGFVLRDGVRRRGDQTLDFTMLSIAGDPVREAVASRMVQEWSKSGIRCRTRAMDLGAFVAAGSKGQFEILFAQRGGPLDADLRAMLHSQSPYNFGGVADEALDRALEAVTIAFDRSTAIARARALQELLARAQPISPLYFPRTLVALGPRVRGATPDWLSPFSGLERWWVADGGAARAPR